MTKNETPSAEFLDLLIEKGPALRKAGFAHLQFGEVNLTLHPQEPEYGTIPASSDSFIGVDRTDPLDDPTAYGLGPGEKLPWDSDNAEPVQ